MELTEEQIADFLRDNPNFFDRHPAVLADLHLPNLHGSGVVSLTERQLLTQRDRARVLQARLDGFIALAKENDTTSDKVHKLSLHLLNAADFDDLIQGIYQNLRENFAVPFVGIRLWAEPASPIEHTQDVFAASVDELKNWVRSLKAPYCGLKPDLAFDNLFEHTTENSVETPKSCAMIALGNENSLGLLALASHDEKRFYPEMGTLYLKRIGELVSASLMRYLE